MINDILIIKRDLIINTINKISSTLEQRYKLEKNTKNYKIYKEKKIYICIIILILIFIFMKIIKIN